MTLPPDALARLAVEKTKAIYRLRRADLEREIRALERQPVTVFVPLPADLSGDET